MTRILEPAGAETSSDDLDDFLRMRRMITDCQNRLHSLLGEGVVKGGNQRGNGGVGLVSHVGDTEGLALQLAVAAVDDELVARLEGLVQALEVGVTVVLEAVEAAGPELDLREE